MMKCWNCGEATVEHNYVYDFSGFGLPEDDPLKIKQGVPRHYCKKCYAQISEQYKKDTQEYVRLKKKLMFERAVRIMERQPLDIYDYKDAILAVEEFATEHPDKFDSSYEMIAAIVLVDNEISCKMQYKIGKYQCDFYIPAMKVVLEIDGDRHKHRAGYDSIRDEAIKKLLGPGWNVVRIKTEYLDQKADLLLEAINAVVNERIKTQEKRKAFKELYK